MTLMSIKCTEKAWEIKISVKTYNKYLIKPHNISCIVISSFIIAEDSLYWERSLMEF